MVRALTEARAFQRRSRPALDRAQVADQARGHASIMCANIVAGGGSGGAAASAAQRVRPDVSR